ncbi:hypothetical protein EDM53_03555 [Rickettsiales endosymbiont of Peranema trichophorum]|uniref:hypothetical protein n=1 Tax=Rickettsiales endosymbiont of Peranema trichophorum TaxID=2486577 RepID=UPI0010231AE5|nr:hypothetical protein [Rickettsiales endosymbiont of Peranema trichophorum]RZI46986.1 hypothetical protein EDM53_03555 [Rickettsiales endosymbiont of Peranema trichophorum]
MEQIGSKFKSLPEIVGAHMVFGALASGLCTKAVYSCDNLDYANPDNVGQCAIDAIGCLATLSIEGLATYNTIAYFS